MRFLEIHLEVSDLQRSAEFYQKLLPHVRIVREDSGNQIFLILTDGSAFGLWSTGYRGVKEGRAGQHVHFAFQISLTEFEDYKKKLLELGIEPLEQSWKNGSKSLYFFDFDGHQGEFMTRDWVGHEQ